jgi:hypothetical protein
LDNVITKDDRVAMTEVDYIIHHMNERYINKVPQNVLDFITIVKNDKIQIYVDPRKPLEQQGLKEFTLYFLMILNLKYWCNDERRKDILLMLENNQKKFENKINNIFEQADSISGDSNLSEYRGNNKPKTTIKVEVPKKDNQSVISDDGKQKIFEEDSKQDVLEQLEEESKSVLVQASKESFLKKIVDKIKSFIIKK